MMPAETAGQPRLEQFGTNMESVLYGYDKMLAMSMLLLECLNIELLTIVHQTGKQASLDTSCRCDHYNNFKSLLTIETYLTLDIQLKYRMAMSKFRLSNHKLNIELGRYIVLKCS